MDWLLIIIVFASAALLAVAIWAVWASADIGSGVYVKALCRAPKNRSWLTPPKTVALTFDDGPHPKYTSQVLDILTINKIKATFFVVGERAAAHPEIVRRMVDEGHFVGNHTWSHRWNFPFMSRSKMSREIERTDELLNKIFSTSQGPISRMSPLFRPPFGVTNPTLARALGGRHTVVGWSVRSLDTRTGSRVAFCKWQIDRVLARIARRLKPGAVVLLHDNREGAAELLEKILDRLFEEEYRVVTLDEMFC